MSSFKMRNARPEDYSGPIGLVFRVRYSFKQSNAVSIAGAQDFFK